MLYETERYQLYQIDLRNALANYNYILHCRKTGCTAAIDPTEAVPILEVLDQQGWELNYILSTHHHADHVGGNLELKRQTGCTIVGNRHDADRIPGIDQMVEEGQQINVGDLQASIIDLPGHTIGHIAYFFEYNRLLFSGDTVFSMGCGRLFEGTAAQMTKSFSKIATLPDDTLICAAHEYTQSNGVFALHVDPDNAQLQERMNEVKQQRTKDLPTVPVSLGVEKATNPFFRLHSDDIIANLGLHRPASDVVFRTLRELKNSF